MRENDGGKPVERFAATTLKKCSGFGAKRTEGLGEGVVQCNFESALRDPKL
jgi:hypothetical protein